MKTLRLLLAALLLAGITPATLAPAPVRAAEPAFGVPSAEAALGQPVILTTTLTADREPARIEALVRFPRQRAEVVLPATLSGGAGSWTATATLTGHIVPNTRLAYRFRLRDDDAGIVEGPAAEVLIADERFEWQTVEGPIVRLHWHTGDRAFGEHALAIGERAVAEAAELLGVTETEPIDFFIYGDGAAFREALGPGTRENVGGQAHADIRTMFGLILPTEIRQRWVDVLVAHELTHLVFDTATDNVYRRAPHWLNEGIAVYLSEGFSEQWRVTLREAIARESLIPLDGLRRRFPSGDFRFRLGYAQGVSAVQFFVETYGEPTLWQLVRSYAEGLSDDDAFTRATGADLAAFNEAWLRSLGVGLPEVHGPRAGPPGPLPPGWEEGAPPAPHPGRPTEPPPPAPVPTAQPGEATPPATPGGDGPLGPGWPVGVVAVLAAALVALALLGLTLWRRRPRAGPPPPPPSG